MKDFATKGIKAFLMEGAARMRDKRKRERERIRLLVGLRGLYMQGEGGLWCNNGGCELMGLISYQ